MPLKMVSGPKWYAATYQAVTKMGKNVIVHVHGLPISGVSQYQIIVDGKPSDVFPTKDTSVAKLERAVNAYLAAYHPGGL